MHPYNLLKAIRNALLLLVVAILPAAFSQSESPAPAVFGGLVPGTEFTLKVSQKKSSDLAGGKHAVPIPKGVPNFKRDRNVTFKIGAKGQLLAKGISLPFQDSSGTTNGYYIPPEQNAPSSDVAEVEMDASGRVIRVSLAFVRVIKAKGHSSTVNVYYTLE